MNDDDEKQSFGWKKQKNKLLSPSTSMAVKHKKNELFNEYSLKWCDENGIKGGWIVPIKHGNKFHFFGSNQGYGAFEFDENLYRRTGNLKRIKFEPGGNNKMELRGKVLLYLMNASENECYDIWKFDQSVKLDKKCLINITKIMKRYKNLMRTNCLEFKPIRSDKNLLKCLEIINTKKENDGKDTDKMIRIYEFGYYLKQY